MNQQTTVEDVLVKIREHPVFRTLVPMEAGIGWPVPIRRNGSVYLCIPTFGLQRAMGDHPVLIYPPFATITVSWPNLVVGEYGNLRWKELWSEEEFAKPAGTFPHPEIASLTLAQYNEMRTQLLKYFDSMLDASIDETGMGEFRKVLSKMMEPPLLPYYRKLFPKYYDYFIPQDSVSNL